MANQVVITAVAAVVLAGAAAYLFIDGAGGNGLDNAGRSLVELSDSQRRRASVDKDECRRLLQLISKHPQRDTDRGLIRSRAWLELLLGRSSRAWDAIGASLGVEADTDDALVGSRVLAQRFADTGDEQFAHRGATFAMQHFDATRDKASLFLAWQLQTAREDEQRRAELSKALQEAFPDSSEARLAKVLVQYPDLREEAPGAQAELQKLEQSFDVIPVELDLALALFEVGDAATMPSAVERIERVLRRRPSSVPGRTVAGTIAMKKSDWSAARSIFSSLLRARPRDKRAEFWTRMVEFADQGLRGGK